MGNLTTKINDDLKTAMREKNTLRLSVLRMLSSAMKNKAIEKGGSSYELKDEEILAVIKSEAKKRNDSIEAFEMAGRQELAQKEREEMSILEKYLPEQISSDEVEKVVKEIISEMGASGPGDFGKVMGQAMARLKNRADGQQVSQAVKKHLK